MIPVEFYNAIYYNFMLLMVLIMLSQAGSVAIDNPANLKSKQALGGFIVVFILIFMGTRPVSGYFVDMRRYAMMFESYQNGAELQTGKDVVFEMFMKFCSETMPIEMFFFICSVLYILPMYYGCKKMFDKYWYYGFMLIAATYIFWSGGVNGIRSGIAVSFCFLAISHRENRSKMIACFLVALVVHKSVLLLVGAFIFASYFRNTKLLLYGWVASIGLSFAFGSFFENLLLAVGLGGDDERLAIYFSDEVDDRLEVAYVMGFRWDFLLYSAVAVFAGWYYIIRKNYQDEFYKTLFGMFLCANAFWILVIRANFSNRFAALSWFFMGLILVYPLLKSRFFQNQHLVVGRIALGFFGFTYIMLFILESSKG